jgi:YidC/Oxa1 family membrane protein insertase
MPIFANFIQDLLQPLINVFEGILIFFHDNVGLGWGFSIVAMTIVVRALMLPIAVRQFRSMMAMQRLKPQIDELRKKYGDDKQRMNQEMMSFYQENKVNPLGACLPVLLQLPIFISLFYMLQSDLRHDICPQINPAGMANPKPCGAIDAASFLGIPDITNKATGSILIIMILLYVGSQLASSLLMMTAQQDKNQRIIMLALPVVFVPFVIGFPAGLLVYWITTNLWTMVQQLTMKRILGHKLHVEAEAAAAERAAAGPATSAANGSGGKRGGLFNTLMNKAQQANEQQAKAKPETPAATKAPARSGPPPSSRKKKKRSGRRR